MSKRVVTPEDLLQLRSVTSPALSNDGEHVIYVETTLHNEKDKYSAELIRASLANPDDSHYVTQGNHINRLPRWSPKDDVVAFLSNRTGTFQLYVLSSWGEPKQLTEEKKGVTDFRWSPDGKRIAYSSTQLLEEEKEEDKLEPLVVNKMKYKSDASGFWHGEYVHIFTVEVDSGKHIQLTDGEFSFQLFDWTADSQQLIVSSAYQENTDFVFTNELLLLSVESKEIIQLTNQTHVISNASASPDGKYIAVRAHEREFDNATHFEIYLLELASNEWTKLTGGWDVQLGPVVAADFLQNIVDPGLVWAGDSQSLTFLVSEQGNVGIYNITVAGEKQAVLTGDNHVYGFSINSEGTTLVAGISESGHPGDLYKVIPGQGEPTRLTSSNDKVLDEFEVIKAEEVRFQHEEGHELQGWLMKPAGFKEGQSYPLIVEIHGGPHAMYANSYLHEFQTLAARGFGVLYINPRGSLGYGQEFVNAVRGDYGGGDYRDIMSALDYVLEQHSWIDESRLGVTGGSYGGFMTNWIVGHTNRFKAAVTQRSISNWTSFYGVSDIGYYFTEWQIQADLNDVDKLWKHSPLAYVNQIETPLLILHGEKDYRCPIEQAEQLYIALKRREKTTTFIRFPESSHELSRSGKPSLRLKRLEAIGEWFERYL
ncbi:S9 family peptidase [Alkalicoccobacillus murimartini]|uniref:Dipeptidyl aminopeptidase/acylaminoacyl peptidase n=1 Tax=Alkalicoccobacillus murimartini TaxID=171685 RepID=A0ABT9YJK0_9BACI|nr:S9 family peptidase [Alkalicoccobacillus murimartini]MDQ0208007.1 dipeptidyl aminopeptidase/acylaminoacyl peptidase [Alkalicoccobacillus murimartini]